MPAPQRENAYGLTIGRLEAFSDGVFAIAVTLLILEIPHPANDPGHLGRELVELWPAYATYAVSFLTIGIMWLNHHALFSRLAWVDRPLVVFNLALLVLVSFVPFPTYVLGTHLGGPDDRAAALFYSLTSLVVGAGFGAVYLWVATHPQLLAPRFRGSDLFSAAPWFLLGSGVYVLAVLASFLSAPITVGLVLATAVYYLFDRLPPPPRPAVDPAPPEEDE